MLLFLVFAVAAPQTVSASNTPTFVRLWGGTGNDYASGVASDSFGNLYVTGSTDSFGAGSFDAFLLKYSNIGSLLWQRTWGGGKDDFAVGSGGGLTLGAGKGVAIDSAGNVYLAGSTYSFGNTNNLTNVFLLKFDSQGNLLWQKSWGGGGHQWAEALSLDDSGGIYLTGFTNSSGAGGDDVFLLKFNSTGDLQWQRTWGGNQTDEGFGVAVESLGSVYVAGFTESFGMKHVVLLKFNTTGGLEWQRTWGGDSVDIGRSVALDASGNIYLTGSTGSFATPTNDSASRWDAFLLKFSPSGSLLWQRTWGGTGFDHGNGVTVDSTGNVYVTGVTASASGGVFLLQFSTNGTLIQQASWGPETGNAEGRGVTVDPAGHVFLAGIISSPPPYLTALTNFTPQNPMGIIGTAGNSTPGVPSFPEMTPSGTVTAPSASQAYSGLVDTFLYEYAPPSSTSTIIPGNLALVALITIIPLLVLRRQGNRQVGCRKRHEV